MSCTTVSSRYSQCIWETNDDTIRYDVMIKYELLIMMKRYDVFASGSEKVLYKKMCVSVFLKILGNLDGRHTAFSAFHALHTYCSSCILYLFARCLFNLLRFQVKFTPCGPTMIELGLGLDKDELDGPVDPID